MHQLIRRSGTSAVCYACRLWCPLPCHRWVLLNWYLSTLEWRWTVIITAMSCCLSGCFQQSNVSQNVDNSQNSMLLTAKIGHFLCSVISQGKVVALHRWGGKRNHLSMKHRLTTDCAKNYCNRTLIVKVIVENVVTCFLLGHSVYYAMYHCIWEQHSFIITYKTLLRDARSRANEDWRSSFVIIMRTPLTT